MIKTLNNQEGRKVRVRLDGETFEATIVKGDFTDCEQREIKQGEGTYTLRFDKEAEDGGLFWSPFHLEDEEDFKHRGFEIESLGTKLDKHNIAYNVGKRAKITLLDGETRTGVINTYATLNLIDGSEEVMHELTYDEPTDLGFTKYAPIERCDKIELIDEVEITRENIFDHIGERVVYKRGDLEKVGTLVQGSFHDCEGNLVELGVFDVSIRYDKRNKDNTIMFTNILSVFSIMKEVGGSIFLLESEKDSLEIGDVVLITSDTIRGIMQSEDISLPYGMCLQTKKMYGDDILEVEGLDKKHGYTWKIFGDGLEKLSPIENPQQGDRILVKTWNDELVHGLYVPEGANYYDANFDIKQAKYRMCVTSDGREMILNNMENVYKIEEVI